MSLDVLLEAADVLEKQKVASILTSMHEYDKSYNEKAASFNTNTYRSPQEAMGRTPLMGQSDEEERSQGSTQSQVPTRRFGPTKVTPKYTVLSTVGSSSKESGKELYTFKVEPETAVRNRISNSEYHSRSIHNQMEKNRRAQLRIFMNNLRDVIPSGANRRKLTTLTLLQNARAYIESLKEHEEEYEHDKQKLWRRHLRLREFLCQLSGSKVLNIPGIPITPGIRKFTVSQEATPLDCKTAPNSMTGNDKNGTQKQQTGDCEEQFKTEAELSDDSDSNSIGTFSNSDGGETVP